MRFFHDRRAAPRSVPRRDLSGKSNSFNIIVIIKMPPKEYNRGKPNTIDASLLSFRRRSESLQSEYWRRFGYANIPESVFFAAASRVWYESQTKEAALTSIYNDYKHLHRSP